MMVLPRVRSPLDAALASPSASSSGGPTRLVFDRVVHLFRERDRLDGLRVRRRALLRERVQGFVRLWQLAHATNGEFHELLALEERPLAVCLVLIRKVLAAQLNQHASVRVAIPANPLDVVDDLLHCDRRADRRYWRWPRERVVVVIDEVETVLPLPRPLQLAKDHPPRALRFLGVELLEVGKLLPRWKNVRDQRLAVRAPLVHHVSRADEGEQHPGHVAPIDLPAWVYVLELRALNDASRGVDTLVFGALDLVGEVVEAVEVDDVLISRRRQCRSGCETGLQFLGFITHVLSPSFTWILVRVSASGRGFPRWCGKLVDNRADHMFASVGVSEIAADEFASETIIRSPSSASSLITRVPFRQWTSFITHLQVTFDGGQQRARAAGARK